MKKFALALAAASSVALIASAAPANAYTMDDAGFGWVGKGEVQTPFGWNNKALQTNASGVTFTYNSSEQYEAVCTFTTGEGTRGERIHNVDHKKSTAVLANVAYEARRNSNGKDGDITGFHLNGFGATTSTGAVPVVGEACMGNEGHDGLWSSVEQTGSTEGGLYANHGGLSHLLSLTPTV